MSATGPMDPERLVDLRQGLEWNKNGRSEFRESDPKVSPALVEELLAAHDHWEREAKRLQAQCDALHEDLAGLSATSSALHSVSVECVDHMAEVERLRNVARGLAHAVVHRLPVTAYDLAAQVLEGDARGTL